MRIRKVYFSLAQTWRRRSGATRNKLGTGSQLFVPFSTPQIPTTRSISYRITLKVRSFRIWRSTRFHYIISDVGSAPRMTSISHQIRSPFYRYVESTCYFNYMVLRLLCRSVYRAVIILPFICVLKFSQFSFELPNLMGDIRSVFSADIN